MFKKTLCMFTSNTMRITTKIQTFENFEKQIMFLSCRRKQFTKGTKFFLRNSGGLGRILLEKCYQTTIIWFAKLAPPKRKCLIACDCISSQPDNPHPICKSHLKKEIWSGKEHSLRWLVFYSMWRWFWNANFWRKRWEYNAPWSTPNCSKILLNAQRNVEHTRNLVSMFPSNFSLNGRILWRNRCVSL